ncbi:MAG: hypothetical protein QM831_24035 [Kofleriaceae bacterium]
MRLVLFTLLVAPLVGTGPACNSIECGVGTIERDGKCAPADDTTGTAKCGPFTQLEGDVCVPTFPPTQCDPGTTEADTDGSGVTTCIGTGTSAGCSGAFACPTPASGKQTICGQIYNFADGTKFQAAGATGAKCQAGATTGPCALQILALDAVAYANAPTTTPPLATGAVYIDDCGRYRVPDITVPSNPFIALGVDDQGSAFSPDGVTVTTGVATGAAANTKVPNLEAFVADLTTVGTLQTTSNNNQMLANGIYAAIFRTHMCDADDMCTGDGFATQAGVTFVKNGVPQMGNDDYFMNEATRLHVDPNANATTMNGTALYKGASVNDSLAYSGSGGIADTTNCQWESHAAANVAGLLFIQIYRPMNKPLKTCTQ